MTRFRPLKLVGSKISRRRGRRAERGLYLLETIVSIAIGTVITFALLEMLAGSMRTMAVSAGDSVALEILASLSEYTVASGYTGLNRYPGTYTLLINRTTEGTFGPEVYKRPVLLDFVRKQWKEKTLTRAFNGVVTYTVSPDTFIEGLTALNVTIDVSWSDTKGQRHVQRSLTLFK